MMRFCKTYYNFLNPDTCDKIVNVHNASDKKRYDIFNQKAYSWSEPDHSTPLVMGLDILLHSYITQYLCDVGNNDFKNFKAGDFKTLEYNSGDYFSEHYDGDFSKNDYGFEYRYHPITCIIALNNHTEYVGGIINMNYMPVHLNKGDLFIFPSNFCFKHSISKLESGTRYSLVSEPYSTQWGLE